MLYKIRQRDTGKFFSGSGGTFGVRWTSNGRCYPTENSARAIVKSQALNWHEGHLIDLDIVEFEIKERRAISFDPKGEFKE